MSAHPSTVKVKPWAEGQGDSVIINESDFDKSKHELFDVAPAVLPPPPPPAPVGKAK